MAYIDQRTGILFVDVDDSQIASAEKLYEKCFDETSCLNDRTVYKKRESRLAGIIGEIVFRDFMGTLATASGKIPYDFLVDRTLRVDVKCKMRSVPPRLDFEASLFAYQKRFSGQIDTYVFMSTIPSLRKVWFCGVDTAHSFHEKAVLWKAGQTDETNRMKFNEDTLSVKYMYLRRIRCPRSILDPQ